MKYLQALALLMLFAFAGCQSDAPGADGRYATNDRGTVYNGSGYGRWAP